MVRIYDFANHHDYLAARLSAEDAGKGAKSRFSNFIGIQQSYLSQILSKKTCLSLEQADLANVYFNHDEASCDFLILLVSRDRSTSDELRTFFDNKIKQASVRHTTISNHLTKDEKLPEQIRSVYCSSWMYPAVHLYCTLHGKKSIEEIASNLEIDLRTVKKICDFLVDSNFFKKEGDVLVPMAQAQKNINETHSHQARMLTASWKERTLLSFHERKKFDTHFSGFFSLDRATFDKIKNDIVMQTTQYVHVENEKDASEVFLLAFDFFILQK